MRLGGKPLPLWRALSTLFLAYEKVRQARRPPLQRFLENELRGFTALQWFEIWLEVELGAYFLDDPYDPNPDRPLLVAMAALVDAEVIAWALATLDEALAEANPERRLLQFYATWALAKRGTRWPAKYDATLTLYGQIEDLAEIFAALPDARRTSARWLA